jgi:hypothetical protein
MAVSRAHDDRDIAGITAVGRSRTASSHPVQAVTGGGQ